MLDRLTLVIDRTSAALAGLTALLILALFLLQLAVVLLRYVLGMGFIELQNLVTYLFGTAILLGIPHALLTDRHVRVDVLRGRWRPRVCEIADMLAILLLLIPVFAALAYFAWPTIAFSWSIREGSIETGGLPGLFLVKSMVLVYAVMMLLQGLSMLHRLVSAGKARGEPQP